MDECPPEITNANVRNRWSTLSAGARAALIAAMLDAPEPEPAGREPDRRNQTGMPPPQGNPYPDRNVLNNQRERGRPENRTMPPHQPGQRRPREESGSPEEYSGGTESEVDNTRRTRRSRHSSSEPSSDFGPIDPQLTAHTTHRRSRAGRSTLYTSRGGLAAHRLPRNQLNALSAAAAGDIQPLGSLTVLPAGAPFYPDSSAPKDDSKPLDIMKPLNQLSEMQTMARNKMAQAVSTAFREVTGVSEGSKWPKWPERTGPMHLGENDEADIAPINFSEDELRPIGLRVDFGQKINAKINETALTRVSEVAMSSLIAKAGIHATWMNAPDVKLTQGVLYECAKTTFNGFWAEFKRQNDQNSAKRGEKNSRASRWSLRRTQKAKLLLKVIPTYTQIHGCDPTPLLIPDHMSDDASGPEDGEDKMAWKRRMAAHGKVGEKTDAQLEKMSFWENIEPTWRSEELAAIFRALWEIFWKTVTEKQAQSMTERIRNTGCKTAAVPTYAPFNFGINRTFYDEYKDKSTHLLLLHDWYTYEDPPGFGEHASPENGEEEEGGGSSGGGSGSGSGVSSS